MPQDQYIERRPTACPNGHPWDRPGSFLIGWVGGMSVRGHRVWTCTSCGAEIHATPGCSLL
jgi:hypothetical protein